MPSSTSTVATNQSSRYIKRLCKHFAHKVDASYSENSGHVDFSPGTCRMKAKPKALTFKIIADDHDRLETLQEVISLHLDRFARDESFNWHWDKSEFPTKTTLRL